MFVWALLFLLQDTPAPQKYRIGWYSGISQSKDLEGYGRKGVNLTMPYTGSHANNPAVIKRYLDAAAKSGVGVFLEPPREWIRAGDAESLKKWAETWKDHPGLFGWQLYDEPELKNQTEGVPHHVPPETAKKMYDAIRSVDPVKPVEIVFSMVFGVRPARQYADACDIVSMDYYPCMGKREFPNNFKRWTKMLGQWIDVTRELKKKGFVMVIQGFERGQHRTPTYAELRYMTFTTAVRDTLGVLYFLDHWAKDTTRDLVHRVIGEVNAVGLEAIPNGKFMDPAVACSNPSITYRVVGRKLIAVNESSEPAAQVTFTMPDRVPAVHVSFESRELSPSGRSFTDDFEPYGVHVYALIEEGDY